MTIKTTRNLRRISQVLFFLIFLALIIKTNFEVDFQPSGVEGSEGGSGSADIILPYPVSLFLEFDPLTALMTLLSSGTVYKGLLWSLVILIPTIFIGRFFCGWICPLGTLNHWVSEIPSERLTRKGKGKIGSNHYKKYQRIKYYIFFFLIGSAFMGSLQAGLLDPLSLLARSLGTFVLPTIHTGALGILIWIKGVGYPPLGDAAQSVYNAFASAFLPFRPMQFHTIFSIGLFFVLILAFNRIFTRFWCRALCPLGAMLGIFSRFAIFGLKKSESSCTHCDKCVISCQGADNPEIGKKWHQAECHLCLNCQASCPEGSLSFQFFPNQIESKSNPEGTTTIDVTRRKMIGSLVGGFTLFPFLRSGDEFEVNSNSRLVRPPGAVIEEDFLAKCIRCGQCMRVCPNNALHPTLSESGIEGVWTPILIARIGYCEPTCTLCGQVCPTGAILELTTLEKVGDKENPPVSIGTAFFDRGRCLPWAMGRTCLVCEEWCPTSPKAIYQKEEMVVDRKGNKSLMKRPYVDPELCTGCGACEFACPVIDQPAIYLTSIGESRSPENQIILQRSQKKRPEAPVS